MTYPAALELQILACRGLAARWRLTWDELQYPCLPRIMSSEQEALVETVAAGIAATRLLWEAGIRFSFTRVLTEAECVGRPGWNPARREVPA